MKAFLSFLLLVLPGFTLFAEEGEGHKLRQIFDEDWEHTMETSPTWASQLGDRRWNDRWPDLSLAAIEREHARDQQMLARLATIRRDALSPADRLNYDMFRLNYERAIEGFRFGRFLIPLDQRGGVQTEDELGDALRFETMKDYEDWIARIGGFGNYMDQTIALMREGVRRGMVQPKVTMQRLPAQIEKQLVAQPEQSPFFKPLQHFAAGIGEQDRTRLAAAAKKAIAESVLPAFQRFQKFFTAEYFPACLDGVGAWRLSEGEAFYAYVARSFTTTQFTPKEIHEIGLREVARIRGEMEKLKTQVGFAGPLPEFFQMLRTDQRFYCADEKQLLLEYQATAKRIDPTLMKLFRTLPRAPYGVEAIPAKTAPDTTAAYYRPLAADGSRAGTYFVNTYKPESRPRWEMMALSLHEAVPGHHLQFALAQEQGELPRFRQHADYTGYVEGWALYAESLGDELGLYDDPYSKLGQLTYEMWRAVRLVVDTGIHAFRWEREKAIAFFRENAPKSEQDIVNEIDRYISWPGQALAYKIGELKIKELRARATKQLGEKFDVKEFHDIILLGGAMPLSLLEQRVDEWLRGKVKVADAPRPRLQILNGSTESIDIFWLKTDTERVPNGTVAPGANTVITTTLGHRFAAVGCDSKVEEKVTSEVPVQSFRFGGVPAFYTQSASAGGFPIVASAKVNPYALKEAAYLADMMLAKRPDVRAAMIKSGARMCIMAHNEYTTDLPEWSHLTPKDFRDVRARGMGGSETDPYCSCAEENVLGYPGDPYSTECIVIHEFAHNIHLRGMLNVDPTFDSRLKATYEAAMKAGLWKGKYAAVNHHEYFAEGVQSWFDNNRVNDHDHNHVNTRALLIEYDPGLAAMCREVFGDTELKYTKPATRLTGHLAGYDPAKAPTFEWPERLKQTREEIRAKAKARDKAANAAGERKPNILFILADDLGYGDVGCYNAESKVPTPNIDRLAREGMRFTDAHSPSTVCTPSRYTLLTGRMAFRINYRGVFEGVGGPCLIKADQLTLPQMLREQGYATAMTGKWHVGLSFLDQYGQRITKGGVEGVKLIDYSRAIPDAPIHRGFDWFFGTACCPTTDYLYAFIEGDRIPVRPAGMLDRSKLPKHPYAFDNRAGLIAPDFDLEQVDMVFLKKSREFLTQHAKSQPEKPFFLLHSTQAVHLPSFAAKQFQGSTKAGPHGDFIHQLDFVVGELMKTLEQLGLAENTVVMFSSDNGPETTSVVRMRADYGHDGARPWRGVKRDQWEGGHRVPFIVRWPGKIAAGSTCDQTICLTDVMATCAALTGATLPANSAEDSFDLLPVLLGKANGAPVRPYTLHQTISLALAIRRGPWKYLDHRGSGGNAYDKGELKNFTLADTAPDAPGQLYNLASDPGEKVNLFFKNPDIVRELKALLESSKAEGRSAPKTTSP